MNHAVSSADAVLEVELNAHELLAIRRLRGPNTRLFPRIVAGLGAVACFAVLGAMLVSHRAADVEQRTPVWIARIATTLPAIVEAVLPGSEPAPAAAATTVKFANPFDPTEVFELPAGTSAEEAQERIAEILLERAQERVPSAASPARARPNHRAVLQKS